MHDKCGTPECCMQCQPDLFPETLSTPVEVFLKAAPKEYNIVDPAIINKIRAYWPAAKAAIVEALYKWGLKGSGVSTDYVRKYFPELAGKGLYKDRICFFLLQPDLFPETLKSPWKHPGRKQTSDGEAIHEDLPFA